MFINANNVILYKILTKYVYTPCVDCMPVCVEELIVAAFFEKEEK